LSKGGRFATVAERFTWRIALIDFNHWNATQPLSRRAMLRQAACGFGTLGLAALLADNRLLAMPEAPGADALRKPHFPAKAKRVIFLFMHGGPSSIDTWDPKPRLIQDHDKPCRSSAR